jgi:putative membrane protein
MKLRLVLLASLGIALGALLVGRQDLAAVAHALRLAGWTALLAITLIHLVPMALCGLAWRAQLEAPPASALRYVWFRWMRDTGGVTPMGGELLGVRVMALSGVTVGLAIATTVVDVTIEMSAQIMFTLLGLAILVVECPDSALVAWTLGGLVVMLPLLAGLVLAQRLGLFRLLERFAERLAAGQGWRGLGAADIHAPIHAIYARHRRILGALAIHLTAWLVGIAEAGAALALMGVPLRLDSLLVLESLSYALRSAAFFVPAAAGVQEGGYLLLGALLGIGPEFALALSLLKRARELLLSGLGLLAWQAAEGGRLWRRLRTPVEVPAGED